LSDLNTLIKLEARHQPDWKTEPYIECSSLQDAARHP